MRRKPPRKRLLRAAREPARWVLCLGAAGLLQGYAHLHHLGRMLAGVGARPDAVSVRLVAADRMPLLMRHRM